MNCSDFLLLFLFSTIIIPTLSLDSATCGNLYASHQYVINNATVKIPWAASIVVKQGYFQENIYGSASTEFPGILISPSIVLLSNQNNAYTFEVTGKLGRNFFCKNVLLNNPVVFGASHLYSKEKGKLEVLRPFALYTVLVGTTEFGHIATGTQEIPVSHISIHDKFNPKANFFDTTNDFALAHLKSPVKLSFTLHPVCIPSYEDLQTVINNPGFNFLLLYGWNTGQLYNLSGLSLKIIHQDECRNVWGHSYFPPNSPQTDRYCANVSYSNPNKFCVNKDIGAFYQLNGTQYLAGNVIDYVGVNERSRCPIGVPHILSSPKKEDLQWMQSSILCGSVKFTCFSDGKCIPLSKVCNGEIDCSDSSDEQDSNCDNPLECNENEFRCLKYGSCIPISKLRDGHKDCPFGEDEDKIYPDTPIYYLYFILAFGVVFIVGFIVTLNCSKNIVKDPQNVVRELTDEEVNEFFYGVTSDKVYTLNNYLNENIYWNNLKFYLNKPWNKDFEVSLGNLDIGEEIGRGGFGIVNKARYFSMDPKCGSVKTTDVAVKTPISNLGVEEFKILFREIKITAFIGKHDCIVNFIGACTQEIKKCRAHLVVEYCANGNLLCLLRKQNKEEMFTSNKHSQFHPAFSTNANHGHNYKISMHDLFKWSHQVASGMAHLGLKNIIHGDLAARNILLTESYDAKISDFGLSRKLKDTSFYVKTSSGPTPWKWLAVESLVSNTFSQKSDVWSFGVTLWEMFSLGENPYGDISWSEGFNVDLQNGVRLERPQFASEEIYDLLLTTWDADPEKRPSFQDVEQSFITLSLGEHLRAVSISEQLR